MNKIEQAFRERIVSGFHRNSLTKCSQWACAYRSMGQPFPGKWTFKHHPWLKEMHDSTSELNIGQKSAQMGFTEAVLNIAFFTIDVKGRDVLYVLPAKTPDASDFSAARFDLALELSPHLSKMFSDVKNIGHKRAGSRNLYIRGSRSRGGLKSVPVYLVVMDEVDEMTQDNIPLALERTSGQQSHQNWLLSTPTIDNVGINSYFRLSTESHFFFKCPSCSAFIELQFPDNLVITAQDINDPEINNTHLICSQCSATLPHETKTEWLAEGKWVPKYPGRDSTGWHINQLYSSTVSPAAIAKLYINSRTNKSDEQEFYNSKLGIPHAVVGSRVTDTQLNAATGSYSMLDRPLPGLITMGVDQGRWIHCVLSHWSFAPGADLSVSAHCKNIHIIKVIDFEELDRLMIQFHVGFCVIDSQPERRKATEFANRFRGHVRLCFYPEGINTKQIHISDASEPSVSVDRTTWLDTCLGRFRSNPPSITLPRDTPFEYREHIKALTRVYDRDKHGNPIGRYIRGNNDDHYAHAQNYSEIALHLGASISHSQNIIKVL